MPGKSKTEKKCEKCGHVFEAEVIDHVTLSEDGELIKPLRTGKLNRIQCPKCKKVMYLPRSVVINFDPENLIVLYDPAAADPKVQEDIMREYKSVTSYNEVLEEVGQEIEFKIVSDLAQLKKMIDNFLKQHS